MTQSGTTIGWPDMKPLGMSARIVQFSDRMLTMIEGGDARPREMTQLGFSKVGEAWLSERLINPSDWKAAFPEIEFTQTARDEVFLDMGHSPAPEMPKASGQATSPMLRLMQHRIRRRAGEFDLNGTRSQVADREEPPVGGVEARIMTGSTRWVDLSAVDRRLVIAFDGKNKLLCIVEKEGAVPVDLSMFETVRCDNGVLVSEDMQFNPKAVLAAIPGAKIVKHMPMKEIVVSPEDIGIENLPIFANERPDTPPVPKM